MKIYRLFTLLVLMAFTLSASAIDFKKPVPVIPQLEQQRSISAGPETITTTPMFGSAITANTSNSPKKAAKKVVVADDGIIYVTAEKFAYAEAFEGGWFMSLFSDEQEDGDYFMFKFHFKTENPNSPAVHLTDLSQLVTESVDRTGKSRNYAHSESAQLDTIFYQKMDITVSEDENGAYRMEGDIWGQIIKHDDYGNVTKTGKLQQYHLLITQPAPIKPKQEKNLEIVCNPEDCQLYGSENLFFGKDNTTGLYAQLALKGGLSGDFDKDHIMSDYTLICTDIYGSNSVAIAEQQSAKVTLENNKDFDITATFVGTDSIRYNIHMTLTLPDGGEPVDVKITNAQAQSFWGYFQASGYNDTYQAQVSGTLKMGPVEDLSTLSAYVAKNGADYASYALFFHEAELSSDENDQLIVTCSFYANDYKEYKLDMRYVVTAAVDNIDVTCSNSEYINALEKEQAQRITGDSDNGDYTVQITMLGTDKTEGTFAIDGSSAWGYINDNNNRHQMSFLNGTCEVTMDAEKNITCKISADAMDTQVHHFNITMLTKWDDAYMEKKEYDAEEGELNAAFSDQDEVTKENHLNSDGYLYLNIRSNERKELLTLVIYAPKEDRKTFIPAGTYTIADTEELYTIQPCPGVYDGTIYPSYYSTLSDDGKLTTPIFMLEKGTMIVKNVNDKLTFTIDAINSYKRPIHITYNAESTGITDLTTDLAKKQSGMFNLAGQRIVKMQKGLNIVNGRKLMNK